MRFFVFGFKGLVVSLAFAVAAQIAAAQVTAIRGVTVVDVAGGKHLRDRTVLIEGDRIRALGADGSVTLPRGVRVLEGRGKYLIPGLWDMHVHLSMAGAQSLALLVANGVLGVRDMGDAFAIVKGWRDSTSAGTLLGPRIEMAGPIIENGQWLTRVTTMLNRQGQGAAASQLEERISVTTPEEARAAVARVAALGVTMLKVRNGPPTAAYFELLREARRRGLRVVGHPPERGVQLCCFIKRLASSMREVGCSLVLRVLCVPLWFTLNGLDERAHL